MVLSSSYSVYAGDRPRRGVRVRRRRACGHAGAIVLAGMAAAASSTAAAQPPAARPLVGSFSAGSLALAFDSTAGWRVALNGTLAVEGVYELRRDTIVLRDRGGPRACSPDAVGTYTWARPGRTLNLVAVADSCQGRRGALAREWTTAAAMTGGVQALVGLTVIDGTGVPPRASTTLVVENGRIRDVFPDGSKPIPADADRVDLAGRWAIPGLIDAHVHLATDPSAEDARAIVLLRLRNALRGGVTTVRDMGGDARVLAGLARDANLGEIESPSLVYSAIFAGPDFFRDPRIVASSKGVTPGAAPWGRAVRDDTDVPRAVAEAKGAGARALKLYADLPARRVRPLVEEAHRQGLLVWSHAALFPARPSEIVDAGVDVLSHASLLVWEPVAQLPPYTARARGDFDNVSPTSDAIDRLLRKMASRGTILEPTLFVVSPQGRPSKSGEWAARVTARARALGVRIAAGTDGLIENGENARPNLHEELALLVQHAGLTPLEAISAATSIAATALGVQNDRGVLAPGKAADLVILSRDPTADIRNTRSIVWVMKAGKRYGGATP
jgi:imidazolonepropionase-like amidohydrolase